jgi:DHA3 family tetracycline resistance protein-like MFS transporter
VKRWPALRAYYLYEGGLSFAWAVSFTVVAVYFVRTVGMTPLQLVLVGTVMEGAIFLFEVPTGVVADTFGRRLSVVIGLLVQGAGMIIVGLLASFPAILAAYALWGVGWTFQSGSLEAWITDELGQENLGGTFARGQRAEYAGALGGLAVSVALASWSLPIAVSAGGILTAAVGIVLALVMPETGFRPRRREAGSPVGTARRGARLVRGHPLLLLLLLAVLFAGASSEGFDRLFEAHFLRDIGLPALGGLDPVVWFGIFRVGSIALGLLASLYLVRRLERAGSEGIARTLAGATAVTLAGLLVFGFAAGFAVALAAYWTTRLGRSLVYPLYMTWLNRTIEDSSVRATVISMTGQADAVGQIAVGPGVGAVGSLVSIRAALVAAAALLVPTLGLYSRAGVAGGAEPEVAEADAPASV